MEARVDVDFAVWEWKKEIWNRIMVSAGFRCVFGEEIETQMLRCYGAKILHHKFQGLLYN